MVLNTESGVVTQVAARYAAQSEVDIAGKRPWREFVLPVWTCSKIFQSATGSQNPPPEFTRTEDIHPVGECGDRGRRGKVHGGGTRSSPLGSDHHNPIRCTSSVERSGRGIFHHLHTFNIVWIDKVERVVGHTGPGIIQHKSIHYKQRLGT